MWHPDEGMIHSWIDGATSESETRAVDEHLQSCDSCREQVAEARGLVAGASRIVGALDDVPGGVIPAEAAVLPTASDLKAHVAAEQATVAVRSARRPAFWNRSVFRAAAGLAFLVGASSLVMREYFQADKSKAATVASSESVRTPIALSEPSSMGMRRADSFSQSGVTPAKGELGQGKVTGGAASLQEREDRLARAEGAAKTSTASDSAKLQATRAVAANLAGDSTKRAAADAAGIVAGGKQIGLAVAAAPPATRPDLLGTARFSVRFDSQALSSRLEKLPPVLSPELARGGIAQVAQLERETSGCYVISAVSADGDSRRVELASALAGLVELEGEPSAAVDSVTALNRAQQSQQTQQGQITQQVIQGATDTGSASRAGRAGGGGGGAAAGAGAAAAGARGGAARGGGGGGGGRGAGGGRGGRAATAPPLSVRALGWRVFSTDSVEVRIAVDTTFIAIRMQRASDSTMVGQARVTTDSTLGILGTVTAHKATCH